MAIYRGSGGAGDAVTDSSSEATIAVEARDAAIAAKVAAENAQAAAELAKTNAQTAENNAELAETNAETAQTLAQAASAASINMAENFDVTATTLSSGSSATASYNNDTFVLALGLPRGADGAPGAAGETGASNVLSIGTVTGGDTASATITGTSPSQTLNLVLPKGDKGDTGDAGADGTDGTDGAAATIAVGTTTTGDAGTSASVTNSGTSSSAVFNFTIPRGAVGATGATGATGAAGTNGTDGEDGRGIVSIIRTSGTGAAGTTDTFTITYSDATTSTFQVYNGANGTNGTDGTDGTNGTDGTDGVDGRGIVSITRTSGTGAAGTTDTYTISYTDSTTSTFTVYNGADGTGSGSVTSVAMSVPTGLSVSGSPITSNGTLAVTYSSGYAIPTTAKQTEWDTAYGWGNHASAGYLSSSSVIDNLSDVVITTPLSGQVLKYNGTNWINDTDDTGVSVGTVTSVAMTVPTGLSVSGSPITTSGTLAVSLASGYSIPTTTSQTNWDTAYGWGNHASAGYLDSADIGVSVQAYDADLTSWAAIAPSTKQDTLVSGTNIKTVNSTSLLGSGNITTGDVTLTGTETLTNKTLTSPIITGTILEDVYTITDGAGFAIDPTNGSIQLVTLGASRTPTAANWDAGEAVTLMVADGTAYTITWTTIGVTWVGGTAPTLATTGYTVIELWKVGSTIYGALVGSVA